MQEYHTRCLFVKLTQWHRANNQIIILYNRYRPAVYALLHLRHLSLSDRWHLADLLQVFCTDACRFRSANCAPVHV
jgi:hypothetical protein